MRAIPLPTLPTRASRWVVRAATPADAAALQALYALTMRSADWLPPAERRAADFASVSAGERVFVAAAALATAGDGGAGMMSVQVSGRFVHHLYVAPAAQRQGVGRALLDSLVDWLPGPWRLKCVTANLQAMAFYQRMGWTVLGTDHDGRAPSHLLGYPGGYPSAGAKHTP